MAPFEFAPVTSILLTLAIGFAFGFVLELPGPIRAAMGAFGLWSLAAVRMVPSMPFRPGMLSGSAEARGMA